MERFRADQRKLKNRVLVVIMAVMLLGLSFLCWTKEEEKFSDSERRTLQAFPKLTVETIWSGKFMKEFETYCLDQFPLRDKFRSVKALANYGLFQKKDNNGIYEAKGHLSKIEYPLNENMLEYAADMMKKVYHNYLEKEKSKCYFIPVPDKNYYLAAQNGYLAMDYEDLFSYMKKALPFAEYVDITSFLELDDYYRTDTHWRQERILDVAEYLKELLNDEKSGEKETGKEESGEEENGYTIEKLEQPFFGVYYGQAALPVKGEELYYLNSEVLKNCRVTSYDTGRAKETSVYTMEKAKGKDPYEVFLSGASAILVIENPMVKEEKELLVFRDSFGSSLVPLLADEYSKITLIDLRYVQSDVLGSFIDFHGQDTLFLYSTLILNNSLALR